MLIVHSIALPGAALFGGGCLTMAADRYLRYLQAPDGGAVWRLLRLVLNCVSCAAIYRIGETEQPFKASRDSNRGFGATPKLCSQAVSSNTTPTPTDKPSPTTPSQSDDTQGETPKSTLFIALGVAVVLAFRLLQTKN